MQATKKEKQWIANEHPTILGKLSDLDLPRDPNKLLLESGLLSPVSFIEHKFRFSLFEMITNII